MWLREDGSPYYVGKGLGKRAFISDAHGVHRPKDRSRIILFEQVDEAAAFESETALIELFGRKDIGTGCLRNLTDGGENPPSWLGRKRAPWSDERRKQASEAKKGLGLGHANRTTPAGIEKMRAAKIGKYPSALTRQRMSESQTLAWLKRKAIGERQL